MKAVQIMLIVVGLIHLIPLKGALGGDWIAGLYGISIGDRDLELLMRHRAVLFGLLGVFLIASAFCPTYQMPAVVAGLVSTFSFIVLSWIVGAPSHHVSRVLMVDWAATALLIVAGVILFLPKLKSQ
jgi:cellobiose-specific phosphotransferase system component IIC